jgi:hypothetical protein
MKKIFAVILIITIFIFLSCESVLEPVEVGEPIPYMQLNIGDTRQYYNDPEGFYLQNKIIDTTRRADGRKVFIFEQAIILPDGIYRGTTYHFLDDEYFFQTELDTVADNEINPFNEQKIAKIFPRNGDSFLLNDSVRDSDKVFFKVKIIDSLATYCKNFREVAEYEIEYAKIDNDISRISQIYYSKYYGHVGTIFENKNGFAKIFVTYLKVGDKEIGTFTPFESKKIINNDDSLLKLIQLF